MYLSDCHIHTNFSSDVPADRAASVDDVCRAAIERGLSYVAITDHYESITYKNPAHPPFPFDDVTRAVLAAREAYADRLYVALGIEYGEPYLYPEDILPTCAAQPYDVILGSVHVIPGKPGYIAYQYNELTEDERTAVFDDYLEAYNTLVHTEGIDVVTHPTYPLRYLLRQGIPFDMRCWEERMHHCLSVIIERGIGLEFNASPRRTPNKGYPDHTVETLMRWYRQMGGEIVTFASDAHFPEHVGAYCDSTMRILAELGFRYIAVYQNRKPIFHPIK